MLDNWLILELTWIPCTNRWLQQLNFLNFYLSNWNKCNYLAQLFCKTILCFSAIKTCPSYSTIVYQKRRHSPTCQQSRTSSSAASTRCTKARQTLGHSLVHRPVPRDKRCLWLIPVIRSTAVQQLPQLSWPKKCNHDFSRPRSTRHGWHEFTWRRFFPLPLANDDCWCRRETAAATVNRCRNVDEACQRTRPKNKMYKHQKFTQLTLIWVADCNSNFRCKPAFR